MTSGRRFNLATFYREKLRAYAIIRVPKMALWYLFWFVKWRVARPAFKALIPRMLLRRLHTYAALGGGSLKSYLQTPAQPLLHMRTVSSGGSTEIFPAGHVRCAKPIVYPADLAITVPLLDQGYNYPAVTLDRVHGAEIVGRTNMVFMTSGIAHHRMYQFTSDFTSEELHGKIRINPERLTAKRYARPTSSSTRSIAATFTDAVAPNYAHWLTEVLPRLYAYSLCEESVGVPVVIDEGLHANLQRSAALVSRLDAVIETLPAHSAMHLDVLHVVSPAGYIPFEPRGKASAERVHGAFNSFAFESMRAHLSRTLGTPDVPPPKKILLRRNSGARRLRNEKELEDVLAERGFTAIDPERLSFESQFHLFSNAEVVVGATGAALANLVFCALHTRIVICISAHPDHSFGYWQNLACAVGNKIIYVLGPLKGPRAHGIHADFAVDAADVLTALEHPL